VRRYIGERAAGVSTVWIIDRGDPPAVREIVVALAELHRLTDDGPGDAQYEARRKRWLRRKDDLLDRIRVAETAAPRRVVHRTVHSPTGFEWGYAGNGPADLSHALLLAEVGVEPTAAVRLAFRDDVVSRLPTERFDLPAADIWTWISHNRAFVERELFLQPNRDESEPAWAITSAEPPAQVALGSAPTGEATASALVAACEGAWRDIQRHHTELPDVVIVLGTGVERGRLVKLGHWWGGRWVADGQTRGEVLIAGEALHLEPKQVFEVLLHEAAHGINASRGVKDTSRGGRYHNQRFADTAREVQLRVRAMPPYGLANTSLTPDAEERYADTIEGLGEAMRIARQLERGVRVGADEGNGVEGQLGGQGGVDGKDGDKGASKPAAVCSCGRRLRMAPSVLAAGPVICGLCGSEFSTDIERSSSPTSQSDARLDATVDTSFLARRQDELVADEVQHVGPSEAVVERRRALLAAALATARPGALTQPLRERADRLSRLLNDAMVAGPPQPTAMQREGLSELGAPSTTEDAEALARWYERFGTLEEQPMPARSATEAARRERLARSLLKADGSLSGPAVRVGDREVMTGDRLQLRGAGFVDGPPQGALGTVDSVDADTDTLDIDFATWGRLRTNVRSQLAQALRLDYTDLERESASSGPDPTIELGRIDTGVEL
jgi:hypothetical protein